MDLIKRILFAIVFVPAVWIGLLVEKIKEIFNK